MRIHKWSIGLEGQLDHYSEVIMSVRHLKSPASWLFTNCLSRCRSKKTPKLHVTGLCVGNSPVTGEFPALPVTWKMFPFDDVVMMWGNSSHGNQSTCRDLFHLFMGLHFKTCKHTIPYAFNSDCADATMSLMCTIQNWNMVWSVLFM